MRALIAIVLLVIGSKAAAQGCDSCLQAAANAATSQMTAGMAAMQAQIQLNTAAQLEGMAKAAGRIDLATEKLATNTAEQFKALAVTIEEELKRQTLTRREYTNEDHYGSTSMPQSLNVHADRAQALREAWENQMQVYEQMQAQMQEHQNVPLATRETQRREAAALLEEGGSIAQLLTQRELSTDQISQIDQLLKIIISPEPHVALDPETVAVDPASAEAEFEGQRRNAVERLTYAVVSQLLVDRQPSIDVSNSDWGHTYVQNAGASDGKISWRNFLRDETLGRLESVSWYNDLRTLNPTGLLREQLVMQSIRNHMLAKQVQQQESLTMLTALMAAEQAGRN